MSLQLKPETGVSLTQDSNLVGSFAFENVIIVTGFFLLVLSELIEEEYDREYEDAG